MATDLGILLHPAPDLRRVSRPVRASDPAVRALAEAMSATLSAARGLGLSAIQVGVPLRLVVARLAPGAGRADTALLDPVVAWASAETRRWREGCLSLPGLRLSVERAAAVRVRYLDLDGAAREVEARGLRAAVLQHELDHLDGRLIIDRAAA